jgi:hypothetical protein
VVREYGCTRGVRTEAEHLPAALSLGVAELQQAGLWAHRAPSGGGSCTVNRSAWARSLPGPHTENLQAGCREQCTQPVEVDQWACSMCSRQERLPRVAAARDRSEAR